MKKTLCIILAVMLLAVSLCACGTGANPIAGSWSGTTNGIALTMSFEKDGSGAMSALDGMVAEKFTYKTEGSTLTVTVADGEIEIYEYSIDGDKLTLTTEDQTITLTRNK